MASVRRRAFNRAGGLAAVPTVCAFALALGVSGVPGHAQEPSEWSVTGRVLSADTGRPIEDVQVYYASERDGTLGVLSGSDGGFALSLAAADSVVLNIERIGYCMWTRVITPGMQTEGLVVELLPYVFYMDEITPRPPVTARSGVVAAPIPISRGAVTCPWQDRVSRVFRLGEAVPWDFSLRDVVEAALQHPDVVATGNEVRGDEPLVVAVDDPSLAGMVVRDTSLPHRFATGEAASTELDEDETPAIAFLTLQGVRPDTLQLRMIFETDGDASGDRVPSVDMTVVQEQGTWRTIRP